MKFMVSWTVQPGKWSEATKRFLDFRAEGRPPVQGTQSAGDWVSADGCRGWGVLESESAQAVYESNVLWSDLLDFNITPIVTHDDAEPILRRMRKK